MTISSIEKIIIEALSEKKHIEIENFDGLQNLHSQLNLFTFSPFSHEVLSVLFRKIDSFSTNDKTIAKDIAKRILIDCNDEFGIVEIINLFEKYLNVFPDLIDEYITICLMQSSNKEKNNVVRGWFLEAAFLRTLSKKSKRFTLISHLVEISKSDAVVFLKYASNIYGLAYSNWQEEELILKLKELQGNEEIADEVNFELGMCHLQQALNSQEQKSAICNFKLSKEFFSESAQFNPEMHDAIAYRYSIEILLLFQESKVSSELVAPRLKILQQSISLLQAWHSMSSNHIWSTARHTEIINWTILCSKIESLSKELDEPTWFDPADIIETQLLITYTASQTILMRTRSGGVETLIQPKIQSRLVCNKNHLYVFEKWLERQDDSELRNIGASLKEKLQLYKANVKQKPDTLLEVIDSPQISSHFNTFLSMYRNIQTNNVSFCVENIFDNCANKLSSNKDYANLIIKKNFNILLFFSLTFLESRINATKQNFPTLKYLFDKKTLPKENELQHDYYQFMSANLIDSDTSVEKSDKASGRVDVYFSFRKFNIAAEIKRDFKDCSFKAIRDNYIGQTAEYSTTDAKLGFLVVLDLTDKTHGLKSIESYVKVEIVKKDNDNFERAIVVIIVPGMKKTPSSIKI